MALKDEKYGVGEVERSRSEKNGRLTQEVVQREGAGHYLFQLFIGILNCRN